MGGLYREEKKLGNSQAMKKEMKESINKKSPASPLPDTDKKKTVKKIKKRQVEALGIRDEEYFDRLLNSAEQDKLAEEIKKTHLLLEDDWQDLAWMNEKFVNSPPVAVRDGLFGPSEKSDVARRKKTFGNADLCTSREYQSM